MIDMTMLYLKYKQLSTGGEKFILKKKLSTLYEDILIFKSHPFAFIFL